jgi:hypothetical protein
VVFYTASGKPKRTVESRRVERTYRNVVTLFLSGQLPNFTHERTSTSPTSCGTFPTAGS